MLPPTRRGGSFLPLAALVVAGGGGSPRLAAASVIRWPCSLCVYLPVASLLGGHQPMGLSVHPTPGWLHLDSLPLQRPCFQIRSHTILPSGKTQFGA